MKQNRYDIFISYRRVGGKGYARTLKPELEKRGYCVFLDFDELDDGVFDQRIKDAISSAPVFLLVLSEGVLDRCANEGDWIREEILYANKHHCHIVPVVFDKSFREIPVTTPDDISKIIGAHSWAQIDTEALLQESIDKLVRNQVSPYVKGKQDKKDEGAETHVRVDAECECYRFNKFFKSMSVGDNVVYLGAGQHDLKFRSKEFPEIEVPTSFKVEVGSTSEMIDIKIKHLVDRKRKAIRRAELCKSTMVLIWDAKWIIFSFILFVSFLLYNKYYLAPETVYNASEWPELSEQEFKSGFLKAIKYSNERDEQGKTYSMLFREQKKDTFMIMAYSILNQSTKHIRNDIEYIELTKDQPNEIQINVSACEKLVAYAFCNSEYRDTDIYYEKVIKDHLVNTSMHSRVLVQYAESGNTMSLEILPPKYRSREDISFYPAHRWCEYPPELPSSDYYQSFSIKYVARQAFHKGLKWELWGTIIVGVISLLILIATRHENSTEPKLVVAINIMMIGTMISFFIGYFWSVILNLIYMLSYYTS